MKLKHIIKFLLVLVCLYQSQVFAANGHNGILFKMNQKQVESLGFVCQPHKEKESEIKAVCEHMDMTGVAFGYSTKDYSVKIGPSGKVYMISADFNEHISTSDYLALHSKIKHFFPIENKKDSFHAEGHFRRDIWNAKDGSSAVLLLISGIPPISKTKLSIIFWSPEVSASSGKK